MSRLLVITGPPGAGKSTVAAVEPHEVLAAEIAALLDTGALLAPFQSSGEV